MNIATKILIDKLRASFVTEVYLLNFAINFMKNLIIVLIMTIINADNTLSPKLAEAFKKYV